MSIKNNMEIQDHLGNVYYPKTVGTQVEMEDGRFLNDYNVSTTQKGFMSAEDKVKLDNISKEMSGVYEEISSTSSATVNNTVTGSIQEIEILGNTYQNPSNLAEIKSVGKLRDDGLYEVTIKTKNEDSSKETVATIKLPCQLEGIGDIKDRFYFDKQQGKWFIEKKIGSEILVGNDKYSMSNHGESNGICLFAVNDLDVVPSNTNQITNSLFCNKFRNISADDTWSRTQDMSCSINTVSTLHFTIGSTKLTSSTVEGFKKWLSQNNTLVKYITKTPQLIELPLDTQIVLNSFDGITHMELDGGEIQGTIKCKIPKSLKSSVNSLVEKTDSLDNRVKQIEGLKESQSLAYQSPKGSLVCTDTKNGVIEDLKISGKTLVNCIDKMIIGSDSSSFENNTTKKTSKGGGISGETHYTLNSIKPNTTYTLVYTLLENTISSGLCVITNSENEGFSLESVNIDSGTPLGLHIKKLTSKSNLSSLKNSGVLRGYFANVPSGEYIKHSNFVLLEGDYTETPELIPEYFEGIKSVGQDVDKIEILSRGKNLFNIGGNINQKYSNMIGNLDNELLPDGGIKLNNYSHAHHGSGQKIKVKPNTTYKVSGRTSGDVTASLHSNSKNYIYEWNKISNPFTVTFNSGDNSEVCLAFTTRGDSSKTKAIVYDIMVTEGNQQLTYEKEYHETIKPLFYYNADGDMKIVPELREWDTVEKHSDGKYYYHKRSEEVVLRGDDVGYNSLEYGADLSSSDYKCFGISLNGGALNMEIINDKLATYRILSSTEYRNDRKGIWYHSFSVGRGRIGFTIPTSELNSIDTTGFNQWLHSNNVTVVYQLAQEEVYECVDSTLSSFEGVTNFQSITGAIKPNVEFKISSHINNVVLSNRDRINNIEKDFVDYVASQSAITLETRYMLDNMLPNNIDDYEENIDYNIYELLKKNIENDNIFIKKEKLIEMLDFYLNTKKITQEMYYELSLNFIETGEIK